MVVPLSPTAKQCEAKNKQTGLQCKNPALVGLSVCRFHGGANKASKRKSAIAKVERKMEQFALPIPRDHELADPIYGLEVEYRRTQARLIWLDKQIGKLTEEAMTWGKTKVEKVGASETPGSNTTFEARLHPYLELQDRERKHLLQIERTMADHAFKASLISINARNSKATFEIMVAILERLGYDIADPRVRQAIKGVLSA